MVLLAASCVSAFVEPAPSLLVATRGASVESRTAFQPIISLFNPGRDDPEAEEDGEEKPSSAEMKKLRAIASKVG